MKKIVSLILVCIFVMSLICTANVFAAESNTQDDIIEELINAICEIEDKHEYDDISLRFVYNINENKYLFEYSIRGRAYNCMITTTRLGEYKLRMSQPHPVVYINGVIYGIKEAYQKELLTNEDLEIMAACENIFLEKAEPILGDVDDDFNLDVLDATYIQRFLAGLISDSEINLELSDFDCDGELTVMDATAILRSIANL